MVKYIAQRKPLIFLLLAFIASNIIFWPGIVSPDAAGQYAAAQAGVYTDHHPPVMSFVWRYLDQLYAGSGLILLMHLIMLYTAAAILVVIFKDSKFKWWYAILPLIPNIFSYTPLIVKDVGFAYSYLLAAAILAWLMVNKTEKNKYVLLLLVISLLFYGTAVKYQARFLLIFLTLGVGYCFQYQANKRAIITGVVLCLLLLQAMFSFNKLLVPNTQESHSWQLVKLYDLAAISIALDHAEFPEFVKQNPNYSFSKIKQQFSSREVDPLVFVPNAVLKGGNTAQQRTELLSYWRKTVLSNPGLYLQHRLRLWTHNFFSVPSARSHPANFFKNTSLGPLLNNQQIYTMIDVAYKTLSIALQFIWLLPLLLFYSYLSIVNFNKNKYAVPLLMFSCVSLTLLGVLFFMSMASTARYVFICTCLVHASHGFAYRAFRRNS